MKIYSIPKDYFYRCAFPRGRLLSTIEDDISIFANIFISNSNKSEKEFINKFIQSYKKINNSSEKTIQNHRSEMNKLWGLTYIDENGFVQIGTRTKHLVKTDDFRLFFKSFCNKFQFPNGINKSNETIAQISKNIYFKPAKFILELLKIAESKYGVGFSIKGSEISNLIFNDIRVTSGKINADEVLKLLILLRKEKYLFDGSSYNTQHGREFLGYMFLAGLLIKNTNGYFKINYLEKNAIDFILNNKFFFKFNSEYITNLNFRKSTQIKWDLWFSSISREECSELLTPNTAYKPMLEDKKIIDSDKKYTTPNSELLLEIGNVGELIVLKFELNIIGKIRPDKLPLVKRVSNDTSLGFDIQSLEPKNINERKYIEVKTTKRTYFPGKEIFTFFPMSSNEWETARNYGDKYYIYRVFLTPEGYKIFSVRNPIKKEEEGSIIVEPLLYRVILKNDCGVYISEVNSGGV